MGTEAGICPPCGKTLSGKVIMLPDNMIEILKTYNPQDNYVLCSKCGEKKLDVAMSKINGTTLTEEIERLQKSIPIVSAQYPLHWEYEVLGIVTAQSVIGTGMISEFTASIADVFGQQSATFAKKIAQGDESGFIQLRQKTLQLGGNAIISVDIDYAELGSLKGMIMVCMTGTAIRLKNLEILGSERKNAIERLPKKIEKLEKANRLKTEYTTFTMQHLL